jgi:hypothetical protein
MEGRTMSERPTFPRLADADLVRIESAEHPGDPAGQARAASMEVLRLTREVRWLRGLIGPVCEASRAVSARLREVYRDEYIAKAASKEPECLLAKMVAMELAVEAADVEAEAIRAESKGEPHA